MQACNFDGAHAVGKPRDWIPELDGEPAHGLLVLGAYALVLCFIGWLIMKG